MVEITTITENLKRTLKTLAYIGIASVFLRTESQAQDPVTQEFENFISLHQPFQEWIEDRTSTDETRIESLKFTGDGVTPLFDSVQNLVNSFNVEPINPDVEFPGADIGFTEEESLIITEQYLNGSIGYNELYRLSLLKQYVNFHNSTKDFNVALALNTYNLNGEEIILGMGIVAEELGNPSLDALSDGSQVAYVLDQVQELSSLINSGNSSIPSNARNINPSNRIMTGDIVIVDENIEFETTENIKFINPELTVDLGTQDKFELIVDDICSLILKGEYPLSNRVTIPFSYYKDGEETTSAIEICIVETDPDGFGDSIKSLLLDFLDRNNFFIQNFPLQIPSYTADTVNGGLIYGVGDYDVNSNGIVYRHRIAEDNINDVIIGTDNDNILLIERGDDDSRLQPFLVAWGDIDFNDVDDISWGQPILNINKSEGKKDANRTGLLAYIFTGAMIGGYGLVKGPFRERFFGKSENYFTPEFLGKADEILQFAINLSNGFNLSEFKDVFEIEAVLKNFTKDKEYNHENIVNVLQKNLRNKLSILYEGENLDEKIEAVNEYLNRILSTAEILNSTLSEGRVRRESIIRELIEDYFQGIIEKIDNSEDTDDIDVLTLKYAKDFDNCRMYAPEYQDIIKIHKINPNTYRVSLHSEYEPEYTEKKIKNKKKKSNQIEINYDKIEESNLELLSIPQTALEVVRIIKNKEISNLESLKRSLKYYQKYSTSYDEIVELLIDGFQKNNTPFSQIKGEIYKNEIKSILRSIMKFISAEPGEIAASRNSTFDEGFKPKAIRETNRKFNALVENNPNRTLIMDSKDAYRMSANGNNSRTHITPVYSIDEFGKREVYTYIVSVTPNTHN